MWFHKKINSAFIASVRYEMDQRRLVIVGKDNLEIQFDTVPDHIFGGFPTGASAEAFYTTCIKGRYAMTAAARATAAHPDNVTPQMLRWEKATGADHPDRPEKKVEENVLK
jgi:hypothetical protein